MDTNPTTNAPQTTAARPEDCDRLITAAFERGDMPAVLALYEPGGVLHKGDGGLAMTPAEIEEESRHLMDQKPTFTIHEIVTTMHGDGTLATTRMRCSVDGTGPDGQPIHSELHTLEVVRKQADGSWKFATDDPMGSARS